jgi:hypothetical protein
MKVNSNEKLIQRNHKLGNIFSIGALAILAVGLFLPGTEFNTLRMSLALVCLVAGFLVFQAGNYFLNRWGRSPRPDELLTQSMKGLDSEFSVFHYETPIHHLLVGPCGVIALLPYGQSGTIYFDTKKKEWKQKGGNFFLKVFGAEGLGRPASEARMELRDLENYLESLGVSAGVAKPDVLLVFTNPKADVQGQGSNVLFVTAAKLKDHLRRKAKENMVYTEVILTKIK